MFGLQNVGGYEPLFPERYSRALGGVSFDALSPRPGFTDNDELLDSKSHVLDLLNTRYLVRWADPQTTERAESLSRSGLLYSTKDIAQEIIPKESYTIHGLSTNADSLALVTSLANSPDLAQGTEVARLQIFATDNQVINLSVRAGIDTAEWAHERPDIKPTIRHGLATVFDETPVDASFSALRFETRLPFGKSLQVDRVVVTNTTSRASLALWKASLFDSQTRHSTSLTNKLALSNLDASRWQQAGAFDGVVILRNERALPRLWLTHDAMAVDGETALRAIQGLRPFNPRKTALLEIDQGELPQLSLAQEDLTDNARLVNYEPNRIVIETESTGNSVLVVSEMFYPGWEATIDGQPTRILLADYLLRAVFLTAGKHQVEMRYTAPAFRNGAIISIGTLILLSVLFVIDRRKH